MTEQEQEVVLARECEYRLEVGPQEVFYVTLKSGSVELFGVELAVDREYTFRDRKLALFTWYGATLAVKGHAEVAYTSEETPMNTYLNIHAQLQRRRETAAAMQRAGPRVLIAGPNDSGKSTTSRILLNYALRLGEKPTLVTTDVGQNLLSIPGTLSASPLDLHCLSVEEEFILTNPLVYYFGHPTITENVELYRHHLNTISSAVCQRLDKEAQANASGCIVDTPGWVDGEGYDLLIETISALSIDVVLVVGQDRLFSRLQTSFKESSNTSVVKLPRSGGVVPANAKTRSELRSGKVREYFYGKDSLMLPIPTHSPCVKEVSFSEVDVWQAIDMKVSEVMLPVGQTEESEDRLQMVKMDKTTELSNAICGVLPEKSSSEPSTRYINLSSAGFVLVKEVKMSEEKLVLLVPSPGPLPSRNLVLGSIKWVD